jgi:frataxin-like iron-binding protein CyaY
MGRLEPLYHKFVYNRNGWIDNGRQKSYLDNPELIQCLCEALNEHRSLNCGTSQRLDFNRCTLRKWLKNRIHYNLLAIIESEARKNPPWNKDIVI